ncbi:MAG: hypothetical protein QGG09_05810 [Pirellulaceae bacterium]|jgi:hypothetical protein|nr:hypothetical protein [Pirellulaceae bacterium]HJN10490.1 hypothetical protein [Pirellulaceae bacterium]
MAIQLRAANLWSDLAVHVAQGRLGEGDWAEAEASHRRYGLWASLHVAETKGFPADSSTAKAEFAKN